MVQPGLDPDLGKTTEYSIEKKSAKLKSNRMVVGGRQGRKNVRR